MGAIAKVIGLRLILGLFFVSALMVLLVSVFENIHMKHYEEMITKSTQNHLKAAAHAASIFLTVEELDLFHTGEDIEKPEWNIIRNKLKGFVEEYQVLYIYYWRDYGDGRIQYIIDNDDDPETMASPLLFFNIDEDPITAEVVPAVMAGNIWVSDLGAYTQSWDGVISGNAPVWNNDGTVYCAVGVDISDEFIIIQRRDSQNMTILQIIALSVSVIFGVLNMLLYRRKAIQIEEAHVKLQYFNNNLRRAFSTYLSEDVVEEIVSDPTRLQLGGINRHMTAMFTDIKEFTRIAEALTPEQLVDLLNYYLSTMSDIILEQKGTIDKYQGDAIISFFGAPLDVPDHALRACTTAILMKRLEKEVNRYVAENKLSPFPLLTRIGINSGEMVVGNMGTQKKMNYTIISNAVNLASRLEGVNKQYGTWILASEATVNETKERLLTRRLDRIRVVGINEPVRIYEILEMKTSAPSALQKKVHYFHQAQKLFENRNWKNAEKIFSQIVKVFPNDGPSLLYLKRCRQYQKNVPDDNWDGVLNFTEK